MAEQPTEALSSNTRTGTFSGFAAGLLGGGTSAIEKLADTSKKQLTILNRIADNTEDSGGLVFGQ
jgi:hypothetical protein